MSVRQIYETAFDSTVKVSDTDYLDELAQSPVICATSLAFSQDSATLQSSEHSSKATTRPERNKIHSMVSGHDPRPLGCKSYRGLASSRDSVGRRFRPGDCNGPFLKDRVPSRPHSDPLDRRKADSNLRSVSENNSRSNPVFHLPLEETPSNKNAAKTFSPSTEFKKLEVDEKVDSEPLHASKTAEFVPETPAAITIGHEFKRETVLRKDKLALGLGIETGFVESIDARTPREDIKRNHSEIAATTKPKLKLDFSQPSKRPRRHFLEFWTPGHDAFREIVDPSVELEKQGWYHGFINHKDAENALRLLKEGSFLVRCSKTSQQKYALSIKSASGVMHMKISQCGNGKYNLKQQSQSFESIPEMVYHFSMNPLPVYGLERVMLKSPVINQLL